MSSKWLDGAGFSNYRSGSAATRPNCCIFQLLPIKLLLPAAAFPSCYPSQLLLFFVGQFFYQLI